MKRLSSVCWKLSWMILFSVCAVFSLSSVEFYPLLKSGGTASYARLLEWVVSHEFAFGKGSGMEEIHWYWVAMPEFNKVVLGVHTVLAAIALTLAPFQFVASMRRRYPMAHRRLGYLCFGLGVSSMVLAIVYLLLTPLNRTYGGPPFAIGLWGIAVLALYTYIVGIYHAIRKEIREHRAIMMLNFCVLLIAPGLRFWWMAFGWIFEGITQAEAHVAVLMFLGVQSVVLAIFSTTYSRQDAASWRGHRLGTVVFQGFGRSIGLLFVLGFFFGSWTLWDSVFKFAGLNLFSSGSSAEVYYHLERQAFSEHVVLFCAFGLGSFISLVLAPRVLERLLRSQTFIPICLEDALFWCCLFVAGAAHIGRAFALGNDWIRGWGGAFFEGTVGCTLFAFAGVGLAGLIRGDLRLAREYAIHCIVLLLVPGVAAGLRQVFLTMGFDYSDAFLSAAVVSSGFMLSMSYYYTVYAADPVRLPKDRGLLRLDKSLRVASATG